jgi:hypothetical protein
MTHPLPAGGFWNGLRPIEHERNGPTRYRDCVKTRIPPASAAWYFSFNLKRKQQRFLDTTDFSRVVVQLLPHFVLSKKAETETPHD